MMQWKEAGTNRSQAESSILSCTLWRIPSNYQWLSDFTVQLFSSHVWTSETYWFLTPWPFVSCESGGFSGICRGRVSVNIVKCSRAEVLMLALHCGTVEMSFVKRTLFKPEKIFFMKNPLGSTRKRLLLLFIYFIKMNTPLILLPYNLLWSFFSVNFGLEAPERAGSLSLPGESLGLYPSCPSLLGC